MQMAISIVSLWSKMHVYIAQVQHYPG